MHSHPHSHPHGSHGGHSHPHAGPSHSHSHGHSPSSLSPHAPPPPYTRGVAPVTDVGATEDPDSQTTATESESEAPNNDTEAHHQATVVATFDSYRRVALSANQRRRADYFQLPPQHRRLLPGYAELLNKVDGLLSQNAHFLHAVVELNPFPPAQQIVDAEAPQEPDHERLRSTLRSVARDWSVEGAHERETAYTPILNALQELYGHYETEDKAKLNVLVPGAGLGRLAWEIVNAGYTCQANEFSLYMIFKQQTNHVLDPFHSTTSINAHTIHPYLHSFSNIRTNADLLGSVQIPDVDPSTIASTSSGEFSFAAGDFLEIYAQPSQQAHFDVIVTCFFIDTAKNIVEYLERIWSLLKEDGVWINCGPTLWHFENTEGCNSIELSLEDIKALAKRVGFVLENEREVRTSYTTNKRSTLRHEYAASFWTARKSVEEEASVQ
ncbi:BZ3500_MvSof-1268-A1-R1_Chr2-1g04466 [Microbotryum saponariae]|uniref:carnosine N-methyltransferase n=1 Tax=Microbotryum saponariae TaxID=289078 RepID=A0A2X0KED0_9BASI|nr:BZ3500_MvSof-1268-A1-R1_Chr2-1g04466 [Microbotryum saponariae]SCZ91782.1 BZ3501_MvSof-1269-A2-R1_Chr2-1g04122 [Microbotryum saponariae]